jgi:hypothetical protein
MPIRAVKQSKDRKIKRQKKTGGEKSLEPHITR